MTRSVQEWCGATDDTPVPPRVRLRIFERYDGRCQCGCNRKIATGEKWDLDHIDALINGGKHRESNLHPMLADHHKEKTREDVALKSASYKRRKSHHGIRGKGRPSFATNKNGPFRKRMDGTVERR